MVVVVSFHPQPPQGRTRLAARFRFRQAAQHGARLLHQARGPRNFVTNGEVGLFGWLFVWLVGCRLLVCLFICWLVGWLVACLVGLFVC